MSVYHRSIAKGRILQEYGRREEEITEKFSRQINQKEGLVGEKRIRREIANSNERRRMQSINAGFQVLRSLLPQNEGEKLSKAAILQQTTELIRTLQQDKAKILAQNAYFKRVLSEVSRQCKIDFEADLSFYCESPAQLKRKKRDTVESSDEGITADYFEDKKDVRQEVIELRQKLDQEQQLRKLLEMQANALDFHHCGEKSQQILPEIPKVKFVPKHDKPVVHEEQRKEVVPARVPLNIPLHLELEADLTVLSSPQHRCQSLESKSSSMSRRNLETIVEAIRHLEGEELSTSHHVLFNPHVDRLEGEELSTSHHMLSNPHVDRLRSHYIEHGEENENLCVISDQNYLRPENSGRDSPSSQPQCARLHSAQNLHHSSVVKSSSTKVTDSSSSYFSNRYPAVTNVLQGNSAQMQLYYRPDVIVQKS